MRKMCHVCIPFWGGHKLLFMVILLSALSRLSFFREDDETNERMPLVSQASWGQQAVTTNERNNPEQGRRKKKARCQSKNKN